jgi:hypothetical protein
VQAGADALGGRRTEMAKRKLNVKLLRKIQRHVLDNPKRIDMDCFIERKAEELEAGRGLEHDTFPRCGTVGCIAGWAVTLSTKERIPYGQIAEKAKALLGLSDIQAYQLFYVNHWPILWREITNSQYQTRAHAKLVVKRIDHLIATGE